MEKLTKRYVKLKRVTPVEVDNTFDVTVQEKHLLIANGFYTSNCWHPDIHEFITAKQQPGRLTKFNISVNCTDEFMQKVQYVNELKSQNAPQQKIDDADLWNLEFPDTTSPHYDAQWNGNLKEWKNKGFPTIIYEKTSASALWNKIMESTYNRAEPGVLFLDRANYFNPLNYKENIASTNPCFTGNSLVSTNKGLIRFDDLTERFQQGETFLCQSKNVETDQISYLPISDVFSSGVKQTVKLKFSNGMEITCTPDHKLLNVDNLWVEAKHSLGEMFVNVSNHTFGVDYNFNFDVINNFIGKNGRVYNSTLPDKWTDDLALVVGWLIGDGWLTHNGLGLIFGKDDSDAYNKIKLIIKGWGVNIHESVDKNGSITLSITSLLVKQFMLNLGVNHTKAHLKCVPKSIFHAPKSIVSNFLKGLFSADGSVPKFSSGSNYSVTLASSSNQLLNDVQQLLRMFEITHTSIYTIHSGSNFPYITVAGENKTYTSRPYYYDLRIFGKGIVEYFNSIGFIIDRKQNMLKYLQDKAFKNKSNIISVVEVVPGDIEEVFDLTEPINHNFVINSIIAHNCGEQVLAPANVCCLCSLNLTQYLNPTTREFDFNKLTNYAKFAVRFLDNVNTRSNAPLPEYKQSMLSKRRIGVGLMGWGSLLYMMKIPFASLQALSFKQELLEAFSKATYEASIDLAIEKGMFELCEPLVHAEQPFIKKLNLSEEYLSKLRTTGIRNSALMSNQPTGNSSILANIVSGGIEPVFMPEYIRTVIVNTMPEDMYDICPKWYEGEWYETKIFKFTKEGDEEILKGEFDGVVYKIDKNRGLTKEVLCQDYGVRWLSQHDEWDSSATWAKTTANLSAQDHVTDLKGFAEYADSAVSKTINVPHDYPFDAFKDLYIDAYQTGYIKGLTTYRAGTMTTVLSAKDEKVADSSQEEIVQDNIIIPSQSPAIMNTIKAEGKKYYLTTIMDDQNKRPIALFVTTNHHEKTATTHDAVDRLFDLAREKNLPQKWIEETEQKIVNDTNINKLARVISLLLRHGVFIRNIVRVLDQVDNVYVGSFLFQIKKYLSQYINDGEKAEGVICSACQSTNIVYTNGCTMCADCGNSKCG